MLFKVFNYTHNSLNEKKGIEKDFEADGSFDPKIKTIVSSENPLHVKYLNAIRLCLKAKPDERGDYEQILKVLKPETRPQVHGFQLISPNTVPKNSSQIETFNGNGFSENDLKEFDGIEFNGFGQENEDKMNKAFFQSAGHCGKTHRRKSKRSSKPKRKSNRKTKSKKDKLKTLRTRKRTLEQEFKE